MAAGEPHPDAIAAADDYLRSNGDSDGASKAKRWMKLPASDKQQELLKISQYEMNRYQASCALTWKFNEDKIRRKVTTK